MVPRETSWFCFPSSLGKTKLTVSLGTIHLVNNISHRHFSYGLHAVAKYVSADSGLF